MWNLLTFLYKVLYYKHMNIKTKILLAGISLFAIFAAVNVASAQVASTVCNSAIISDFVNLQNGMTTNAWFEWGPTQYFGNSTPLQTVFSNSNFSQLITGLSDNTTYYYRVVMNSGMGVNTTGYTKSFRTPLCHSSVPSGALSVRTDPAINVSNNYTTLSGFILANNDIYTSGYFEYGTTQTLGNTTSSRNLGSMQSNPFYETLVNLAPDTTYYYRAVISNQYGISRGNIASFRINTPAIQVSTSTKKVAAKNTTTIPDAGGIVKNNGTTQDQPQIQQGALAFLFGGDDLLPNTLIGWFFLLLLATLIILAVRKAYSGSAMALIDGKSLPDAEK